MIQSDRWLKSSTGVCITGWALIPYLHRLQVGQVCQVDPSSKKLQVWLTQAYLKFRNPITFLRHSCERFYFSLKGLISPKIMFLHEMAKSFAFVVPLWAKVEMLLAIR